MNATDLTPLFAALATARDKCGSVEKDGFNKHFTYAYASSEAIFGEARSALAGAGLSLVPIKSGIALGGGGVSEHGEPTPNVRLLTRTFLLVHSGGASLEIEATPWPIVPEKGRPIDKALAIATTTQLAYTYRDLLLMRRGGDDQDDAEPATKPAYAPRHASAAPRPETAAETTHPKPAPAPAPAIATASAPVATGATVPVAAPGPSGSTHAGAVESPAVATPAGPVSLPVLEAPAATPAANGSALANGAGPLSDRYAEDERVANKLGDEHWELAMPLCDGDLAAPLDRELAKSVLAVGTLRLGSLNTALELWAKVGIPVRTIPTRAQARAFLLKLPDTALAPA